MVANGLVQYREIQSSGSYLSFSDLRAHFGVGKAQEIDLLEIRWPSGQVDKSSNLAVNQRLIAIEGGELRPFTKKYLDRNLTK